MKRIFLIIVFANFANSMLAQCYRDTNCLNEIAATIWKHGFGKDNDAPKVYIDPYRGSKAQVMIVDDELKIVMDSSWLETLHNSFEDQIEDALAAVIGHELYHAAEGKTGPIYGEYGENEESVKEEEQADLQGLFAAYFAGFPKAINTFEKIITTLPDNSKTHPNNNSRIETKSKLHKEAEEIQLKLEIANILLVLAEKTEIDLAIMLLNDIKMQLSSFVQIDYAIGLAWFSYALREVKSANYYPVNFVPPSLLPLRDADNSFIFSERAKSFLDTALFYFDRAKKNTTTRIPAMIASACIYIEMGQHETARLELNNLKLLPKIDEQIQQLNLIEAILDFKESKNEDSLLSIVKSSEYSEALKIIAQANLQSTTKKLVNFDCPNIKTKPGSEKRKIVTDGYIIEEYDSGHSTITLSAIAGKYNFHEVPLSSKLTALFETIQPYSLGSGNYFYQSNDTCNLILIKNNNGKIINLFSVKM